MAQSSKPERDGMKVMLTVSVSLDLAMKVKADAARASLSVQDYIRQLLEAAK